MRRRDFFWSLYHAPEQNQLDNLRTDQVEAIFAAIPERHRHEWWIWREGFESWKQFEDFPQLLVSLRQTDLHVVLTPRPPTGPAPKRTKFKEPPKDEAATKPVAKADDGTRMHAPEADAEITVTKKPKRVDSTNGAPRFVLENDAPENLSLIQAIKEDRGNLRFERELGVRVIVDGKTFQNQTVNVSLKGMQLKSALPKNLPRYFNVEIVEKNRVIPLVCSEIRNKDGSPSNRVKFEVDDYSPALLAMLLAG